MSTPGLAPAVNPLKTATLFSRGAPYGTDTEGDEAQAAAQVKYASARHASLADRAPFEMAASFQETIGGNPLDNQNRHGYAIVEDHPESDALASLMENHAAYEHCKMKTYNTEAAECVFPTGPRPVTVHRARPGRFKEPPTQLQAEASVAAYMGGKKEYNQVKLKIRETQLMEMFQPPESIVIEKPSYRGVGPPVSQRRVPVHVLGKVDRFKHVRSSVYKIKRLDDQAGATAPSAQPFDAEFSVRTYGQTRDVLNTLKHRGQSSVETRASIFGY
jgi:hypothetical protein